MTDFIQAHYYEVQFAAIFGGMFIFFLLEELIPRRATPKHQGNRWLNNIALAFVNHFIILFYSIGLGYIITKLTPDSSVLRYFELSDIGIFILLLLLIEFITYWFHRAFHKYPMLWRIHAVHHSDTEIDVTTSHRHHPFEPLINGLIATPIIILLGAPVISIVMINLLHTFFALFSHSNLILPKALDNILRKFIATPDFHRMHHSSNRQYTDSNFCVIFPIFDYLFRTDSRLSYEELPSMELGLETMRKPVDSRIDQLLLTPFTFKSKVGN